MAKYKSIHTGPKIDSGGGGNIGGGRMVGLDWTPASHLNLGSGGAPGQGSVGGAGGDGVALIYW